MRGDSVELEKAQIDLTVILTQLMFQYYRPERPSILGGKWGLGLTLPLTSLQLDPGDHEIITCNGSLLSDIVISPFVQIDPIKGAAGPLFSQQLLGNGRRESDRGHARDTALRASFQLTLNKRGASCQHLLEIARTSRRRQDRAA